MSDYFGALMRSSGLSVDADATSRLDTARQVTPSPADYGIVEVDGQVNHAQNKDSAHMTMPLEPMQDQTALATGGEAERPSIEVAPTPSAIEKAMPNTVAPTSEAFATSLPESPVASGCTTSNEAPLRENESRYGPSPDSLPPGPTLVQAALRWIAGGESLGQVVPDSALMVSPRLGLSVASKEVQAPPQAEGSMGKLASKQRRELFGPSSSVPPLRTQAVKAPQDLHDSAQHGRVQAHAPASENGVEVTIGSINVRVSAPPSPAVAVTVPSPTLRTSSESPPRSGFSRRTLWRI